METKTFKVSNIGCDGCVNTIKNEISTIPGVARVNGSKDSKLVTVEWNTPATWEQIEGKLKEIEYAPDPA